MAESKIEWTDRSDWNPIRGCTRVSPGCGGPGDQGGCYAEAIAARFSGPGQPFHGYAERTAKGGRWTGKVEVQWDRLELPLRWRKPAMIFASSTSDFFHKDIALGEVATLFGVMIAAHHVRGHTFQVLTKRADLMRQMLTNPLFWEVANIAAGAHVMELVDPLDRRSDDARATCDDYGPENPPPGIWLGVSVEDQTRADERIPDLLATPAAVRFLSCEPLLGPVDLMHVDYGAYMNGLTGRTAHEYDPVCRWPLLKPFYHMQSGYSSPGIDWVIAGGESGPNARPMHPTWARSLRDQCAAAGVPFHFKQNGEWVSVSEVAGPGEHYQFPDGATVRRTGKKLAGRLLDGIDHNGLPEVQP